MVCEANVVMPVFSPVSAYGDGDVPGNPDDLLPPVQKLEKYADSENIFNR